MTRTWLVALSILVVGNLLLWPGLRGGSIAGAAERLDRATASVVDGSMQRFRFAPDPLLPDDYVGWRAIDADAPFISLYAAVFSRDGFAIAQAHDPELCYGILGWTLVERLDETATTPAGVTTKLLIHHFIRGGDQPDDRAVIVWRQPRGRVESIDRPWWREHVEQLTTGRTDYVWIRAELPWSSWQDPLPRDAIRTRIVRLMSAIEAECAAS